MKKLKKNSVLFLMCLSMLSTLLLSGTIFAQTANIDSVEVNDIISNVNNEKEIVIKVNEDSSFITLPLELSLSYSSKAGCMHYNLIAYGLPEITKESHNKANSTYCYRERTVQYARCTDCGQSNFRVYGTWTEYKHSYGFLSNKCKECGYEK